jgi:alpha/beta superfamily hydrolase
MKMSPSVKPALWGAVGGAIACAVLGFTWGGWVSNSSANAMAQERANVEIAKVLAPICLQQFQQQPDAAAKMVELKGMTSSYQMASYVEKSGAATMPGSEKWLRGVGQACAELLVQAAK